MAAAPGFQQNGQAVAAAVNTIVQQGPCVVASRGLVLIESIREAANQQKPERETCQQQKGHCDPLIFYDLFFPGTIIHNVDIIPQLRSNCGIIYHHFRLPREGRGMDLNQGIIAAPWRLYHLEDVFSTYKHISQHHLRKKARIHGYGGE